jgi:hypothetical protein
MRNRWHTFDLNRVDAVRQWDLGPQHGREIYIYDFGENITERVVAFETLKGSRLEESAGVAGGTTSVSDYSRAYHH